MKKMSLYLIISVILSVFLISCAGDNPTASEPKPTPIPTATPEPFKIDDFEDGDTYSLLPDLDNAGSYYPWQVYSHYSADYYNMWNDSTAVSGSNILHLTFTAKAEYVVSGENTNGGGAQTYFLTESYQAGTDISEYTHMRFKHKSSFVSENSSVLTGTIRIELNRKTTGVAYYSMPASLSWEETTIPFSGFIALSPGVATVPQILQEMAYITIYLIVASPVNGETMQFELMLDDVVLVK